MEASAKGRGCLGYVFTNFGRKYIILGIEQYSDLSVGLFMEETTPLLGNAIRRLLEEFQSWFWLWHSADANLFPHSPPLLQQHCWDLQRISPPLPPRSTHFPFLSLPFSLLSPTTQPSVLPTHSAPLSPNWQLHKLQMTSRPTPPAGTEKFKDRIRKRPSPVTKLSRWGFYEGDNFLLLWSKKKPLAHLSLTHSVPPTGTFILSVARENAATLEKKSFLFVSFLQTVGIFILAPKAMLKLRKEKSGRFAMEP